MLAKELFEEEMRELSDTVEIATLDKEMAEEKVITIILYCSAIYTCTCTLYVSILTCMLFLLCLSIAKD